MITAVTRRVGAHEYTITLLGARDARRVALRLARVLGPAVGEISGLASRIASGDKATSYFAIGQAIASAVRNLSDQDLEDICKAFGDSTDVKTDGSLRRLTLDEQELFFSGRFVEMLEWLYECFTVNFADFFELLGSAKSGTPASATSPESEGLRK